MPTGPQLPIHDGAQPCFLAKFTHGRSLGVLTRLNMAPRQNGIAMSGALWTRPPAVLAHHAVGRRRLPQKPPNQQHLRSLDDNRDCPGNLHDGSMP
jgi:hypothetical protein